jgi:plasmid stabilization system protein ParE
VRVVYTELAERQLANALAYGIERHGERTAERTYRRLVDYVENTLATFPRVGRYQQEIDAFEAWAPRTPFVVVYRLDQVRDALVVLAIFHSAQDRSAFDPEAGSDAWE